MDNPFHPTAGDLADILRPTAASAATPPQEFHYPPPPQPPAYAFGDPFTGPAADPLLSGGGGGGLFTGGSGFSRAVEIMPENVQLPECESPAVMGMGRMKGSVLMGNNKGEGSGSVQMSSPRNHAIKGRKSQAKKVVCIPAPAVANSRQSGEVVPSDLWAWRKYGQKPIKGSPYPRGYYRCSSSKGCSARKQVERSRTDPNMLVITYTSEHNHPWPTQRNALAGSTRSQPSKTPTTAITKSLVPIRCESQNLSTFKEEAKDIACNDDNNHGHTTSATTTPSDPLNDIVGLGDLQSYRPTMVGEDCFFAELGELEVDPLNLLFNQDTKGLDSFTGLFDWANSNNNNNNNNNNSSSDVLHVGEAKGSTSSHQAYDSTTT